MYRVKAQTQDLARRRQNSRWPVDSTTVLVAQQAGLAGARNIGRLLSSLTPRIQTLLKPTVCLLLRTRCTSRLQPVEAP